MPIVQQSESMLGKMHRLSVRWRKVAAGERIPSAPIMRNRRNLSFSPFIADIFI